MSQDPFPPGSRLSTNSQDSQDLKSFMDLNTKAVGYVFQYCGFRYDKTSEEQIITLADLVDMDLEFNVIAVLIQIANGMAYLHNGLGFGRVIFQKNFRFFQFFSSIAEWQKKILFFFEFFGGKLFWEVFFMSI